ncbi:hypothetical protein AHAS_Ahas09G0255000 [Arachis hypogaea]
MKMKINVFQVVYINIGLDCYSIEFSFPLLIQFKINLVIPSLGAACSRCNVYHILCGNKAYVPHRGGQKKVTLK